MLDEIHTRIPFRNETNIVATDTSFLSWSCDQVLQRGGGRCTICCVPCMLRTMWAAWLTACMVHMKETTPPNSWSQFTKSKARPVLHVCVGNGKNQLLKSRQQKRINFSVVHFHRTEHLFVCSFPFRNELWLSSDYYITGLHTSYCYCTLPSFKMLVMDDNSKSFSTTSFVLTFELRAGLRACSFYHILIIHLF